MRQLLWIGLGGGIGAMLRFGLGSLVHRMSAAAAFPLGTLVVNVMGCLAIGLLAGWSDARHGMSPELRAFLFAGLLGGFTTFSTFGYETFALLRAGALLEAAGNVVLQLVLGLLAVWLGYSLASG